MANLYLLHFEPHYRHAQHYLGVTQRDDVLDRVAEHFGGSGAKLCRFAKRAGCRIMLARIWWNVPRMHEMKLKGRSLKPLCPICAKEDC